MEHTWVAGPAWEKERPMSARGWRVADSDMHVMEPPDLWERYIAPEWRHAAPIGLSELHRDMRVRVKDHSLTRMGRARPDFAETVGWKPDSDEVLSASESSLWDPSSQLDAMDKEGVDLAVLFPSRGLFVLGLDSTEHVGPDGLEPALATAIARAYNDWMADFCAASPRLYGAGLLAPHDVDGAVEETRRCIQDLGFTTVFVHPGLVNGRLWHDPAYDPIWRQCEQLDVAVCFHGGGQNFLQPDYTLGFDNLMMWHTFGQPIGIMAATVSMTAGGVLQRFPRLRVGLLEGNCSWAPWLLERLDEHWEWVGDKDAPELEQAPSEYFCSNCTLSIEADERSAQYYVDRFGDDNLVFSTDYPHGDSKFPASVSAFLDLPLGDETKRKVLWDNWCRLYGQAA
jgi:predicted TIM-barrel fold metal-dependent hydrolase